VARVLFQTTGKAALVFTGFSELGNPPFASGNCGGIADADAKKNSLVWRGLREESYTLQSLSFNCRIPSRSEYRPG
jgi:hypothetical protein